MLDEDDRITLLEGDAIESVKRAFNKREIL